MSSRRPKWSIIIPVFNKEKYIERCLDSVKKQTHKDWEIICIDDSSSDDSQKLIKKYVEQDARIHLIINDCNEGVGASRNKGIRAAQGTYIQFIDADDYLNEKHIEVCNNAMDKSEASVGFINFSINNESSMPRSASTGVNKQYAPADGRTLLKKFVLNEEFFLYACGMVCKRDFLLNNNIFFGKLRVGEGGLFVLNALCVADIAMTIDNHGSYCYSLNDDSVNANASVRTNALVGQFEQYIYMQGVFSMHPTEEAYYCFLNWYGNYISGGFCNLSEIEIEDMRRTEGWNSYREFWIQTLMKLSSIVDDKGKLDSCWCERIKSEKKVALFGAGYDTFYVLRMMQQMDVIVEGIYVSDVSVNRTSMYGHKVKQIDCMSELDKNTTVIVTTKSKHHDVIKQALEEKGFFNICFYQSE